MRDLGIIISKKLDFNTHCSVIARKANNILRNIRRCFKGHTNEFYVKLYTTYVRPLLESNTAIFNPHTIQNIDLLESVQRKFTKFLTGLFDVPYQDRLAILNLQSLEERRVVNDLCCFFKVRHHTMRLDIDKYFVFRSNSVTRGHPFKILKPYARTDTQKYYWANRIIDIWNQLPADVFNCNEVGLFRKKLSIHESLSSYCKGSMYSDSN